MRRCMWRNCRKNIYCGKLLRSCNRIPELYTNIDYNKMTNMVKENRNIILLDVRSEQEYAEGHISGAISIPLFELEAIVETIIPNKMQPIIVYCKSGIRSMKAIDVLIRKEYTNLYNLYGGLDNY